MGVEIAAITARSTFRSEEAEEAAAGIAEVPTWPPPYADNAAFKKVPGDPGPGTRVGTLDAAPLGIATLETEAPPPAKEATGTPSFSPHPLFKLLSGITRWNH